MALEVDFCFFFFFQSFFFIFIFFGLELDARKYMNNKILFK